MNNIKKLVIIMLLIVLTITGIQATEATSPSTGIYLEVAQDGGIGNPFSADDTAVDGNGLHTPGMDGSNGAIKAAHNNVVRTYDMVRYDVHWNINDVDSSASNDGIDGIATNVLVTVNTGRDDVRWVKIPVRCKTAGSSLSDVV